MSKVELDSSGKMIRWEGTASEMPDKFPPGGRFIVMKHAAVGITELILSEPFVWEAVENV